jgi:hypothetical protein
LYADFDRNVCWIGRLGASFCTLLDWEDYESSTPYHWQCVKQKYKTGRASIVKWAIAQCVSFSNYISDIWFSNVLIKMLILYIKTNVYWKDIGSQ